MDIWFKIHAATTTGDGCGKKCTWLIETIAGTGYCSFWKSILSPKGNPSKHRFKRCEDCKKFEMKTLERLTK